MKKQNPWKKSYSFISRLFLTALITVTGFNAGFAQCLVNNLVISTATNGWPLYSLGTGVNDPHWLISQRDAIYGSTITTPIPAFIVTPHPAWGGTGWIADTQPHANPGFNQTIDGGMIFLRQFRVCGDGQYRFDLNVKNDDYIADILVDGVSTGLSQPAVGGGNLGPATQNFNFTQTLATGSHNLEIRVVSINSLATGNAIGLAVDGSISTVGGGATIVNDMDPACLDYTCATNADCNDNCYWRVTGNNILNSNNIFGTLTNHDVRIVTNKNAGLLDRGVIKGGNGTDGGFFGWNTTNPTARLHVNCTNGNGTASYNPGLSDIQFQNLETSDNPELMLLGILPGSGYVYQTGLSINDVSGGTPGNYWSLTGNTIASTDWMGSINFQDVWFRAGNRPSMVIESGASAADINAGFVGINTSGPSARLHVDCAGGNPDGSGASDIRFEALEKGGGEVLVIDQNGYVYNSGQKLNAGGGVKNNCGAVDQVPKFDPTGDLTCSQIFDDGHSVGIGTTGPFSYTPGTYYNGNPSPGGIVTLDVAGETRSVEYIAWSDANYKTGFSDISNPFSIINSLQGKTYYWNEKARADMHADNAKHYGFIAQDVIKVLPEAVSVDADGRYGVAYNSFIPLLTEGQKELYRMLNEEKARNVRLEDELNQLKEQVQQLTEKQQSTHSDVISPNSKGNELYQNVPNPFGHETSIGFNIVNMEGSAFIAIYDLNGRQLSKYPVNRPGKGSVTVNGDNLVDGIYLYSLIVDGKEADTKRMIFTR